MSEEVEITLKVEKACSSGSCLVCLGYKSFEFQLITICWVNFRVDMRLITWPQLEKWAAWTKFNPCGRKF